MSAPLLQARALHIGYPGARPLLASPLELALAPGSAWAVVGPNGAGKTTLLKTLLGLIPAREGRVDRAFDRAGYVPQRSQADPVFPATALDVVLMGVTAGKAAWRWPSARDRELALDWLERVGLQASARKPFRTLSGGQRQRALVARALATTPSLLVLDEPTDGMDLAGEADLLALVSGLRRETGVAVLTVTHALHHVASQADNLVILRGEGGLVDIGPSAELLTPERLSRLYGRRVEVGELAGERVIVVPASSPGDGTP